MRYPFPTAVLACALAACGSSGSEGLSTDPGTAELILTDAGIEDLARFEVDVAGIAFHRFDGATVDALPRAERVDFVSLRELGELVGRVSLAPGRYLGMTITFDFTDAEALVVGASDLAKVFGTDGQPINGTQVVDVEFPSGALPSVVPNRNHVVQLDLDLSQAIEVDTVANQVTFRPVIDVTFDPSDPKPAQVRGLLGAVDASASTFLVRRVARDSMPLVDVSIAVADTTVFQLSGDLSRGASGLAALAAMPVDSRVIVRGVLDASARLVRATVVEAGAGVPGGGQDQVEGWIIERDAGAGLDAALTVFGRSIDVDTGARRYFSRFTVNVGFATTKVIRHGIADPQSTDTLQVGAHVWAFGALDGTVLDAGPVANGIVRALPTTLVGRAGGPAANHVLAIDIASIDALPIDHFHFLVGGVVELNPTTTSLDVRRLDVAGVVAQDRIAATGWFGPVGVRLDEDFAPTRIVTDGGFGDALRCVFPATAPDGVVTIGSTSLTLDIDGARIARVFDGIGTRDLARRPAPTIVPGADQGSWRIVQRGTVTLHRSFAAFVIDLANRIDDGAKVAAVKAAGSEDPTTQRFTSAAIGIEFY